MISKLSPNLIANAISERFSLPFESTSWESNEGLVIQLTPREIHPNEGFHVAVLSGWRSISIQYKPGPFSAELIKAMGQATIASKYLFTKVADQILSIGGSIKMTVNGTGIDPVDFSLWPDEWNRIDLEVKSPFIETEVDFTVSEDANDEVVKWASYFMAMVIALMPVEEEYPTLEIEDDILISDEEGGRKLIQSYRYERSRRNRAACIAIHGTRCMSCGVDLAEIYGDIGRGYIHVHHVTPLSAEEEVRHIDPQVDLVPICPNCHAMIHQRNPPYSIDELKQYMNKR